MSLQKTKPDKNLSLPIHTTLLRQQFNNKLVLKHNSTYYWFSCVSGEHKVLQSHYGIKNSTIKHSYAP